MVRASLPARGVRRRAGHNVPKRAQLATVSRILYGALRRRDDHSSKRPIPGTHPAEQAGTSSTFVPYLVLHRKGFTMPAGLLRTAVGSYPTLSPLPREGRFAFCGTVLPAAYRPRYPAFQPDFLPYGVRTFLPVETERPSIASCVYKVTPQGGIYQQEDRAKEPGR